MSRDALVVGINTYQSLPGLKAPAKDAEAMAQQLQRHGEFRVHRLPEVIQADKPCVGQKTQLHLRELETALIQLFKPKGSNVPETALFYFSGHGIQREAGICEGYLALSDSQPEKGFYGLSLFWLRRLLQESPVKQRIVILDCCHSGELLNFLEADPGARPGTDRLFMAASREYETAFESLDSPYSVFTQAILTGLNPNQIESGIVTNHSLVNAVNHALKGEIQQPLFESSGSEIILTRRTTGGFVPATTLQPNQDCPYRGLKCFDFTDADYFFGREQLTETLIRKLKAEQFVAVVGTSGIGKSSLVRAGLAAQLRQEKTQHGEKQWLIKLLTPGQHPLRSLAEVFIAPNVTALERAEQVRRAETFLQDGGKGLMQLVRASLLRRPATSSQSHPRMVLIIDQFEEVFTLSHGLHAEQERQAFFNCLLGAAKLTRDFLSIVIVVRQDFLPKCNFYQELNAAIEQHQLIVPPLKYEQIKAAILRPAQKVGLICEPHLIYTMLLDISGAPGELPLLQYTLMELWQHRRMNSEGNIARLTLEDYQELGGIRGTLQKRATEIFHSLSPEEQSIAKRIFLALTQLGEGTEDTRRRVMKTELFSSAYPVAQVEQVLEKLVAAQLLVTGETVDVVHEALIRNWSLLREWLQKNREMLRRLRRIEQAAQEWEGAEQPTTGDYLLTGLRLRDAEDFLKHYPHELSALAQQFVAISRTESRRVRQESRQLQIAVPSVLLATLLLVFGQYHTVLKAKAEKEQLLETAVTRERAAIAQSILEKADSDPTPALLISRLAAEQNSASPEAETSLRRALQQSRLQLILRGHTGAVHHLAFSPDRQYLASAGADGTIRLWTLGSQSLYAAPLTPTKILNWSTSAPDQPHPVQSHPSFTGDSSSCQASSCSQATPTNAAVADITSFEFSPDGKWVAAIAQDSPIIKIWSVELGTIVNQITGTAPLTQIRYSPDGQWIAGLQRDQSIWLWNAQTGQLLAHWLQTESVRSLEFSPDGQRLLTLGNQTVKLWQLTPNTANPLNPVPIVLQSMAPPNQATFSPSGRWMATASTDGVTQLWEVATGRLIQNFPKMPVASPGSSPKLSSVPSFLPLAAAVQVYFTPSEQTLVIVDAANRVQLWDLVTGQLRKAMGSDVNGLPAPNLSTPNSIGSANLATPRNIQASLSPSGHLLLTVSQPSSPEEASLTPSLSHSASQTTLWNVRTGEKIGNLPDLGGAIEAIQFSSDDTYVVTAGSDGMVRLWAITSGGEMPALTVADASVSWAMFMPSPTTRPGQPAMNAVFPTSSSAQPAINSINRLMALTSDGTLHNWQIVQDTAPSAALPGAMHAYLNQLKPVNFWQKLMAQFSKPSHAPQLPGLNASDSSSALSSTNTVLASDSSLPPTSRPAEFAETLPSPPSVASFLPFSASTLSSIASSGDAEWIATSTAEGIVSLYQRQNNQYVALPYQIQNWRSTGRPENTTTATGSITLSPRSIASSDSLSATQFSAAQFSAASLPPHPPEQLMAVTPAPPVPVKIQHLAFSADGKYLLGTADDFTVRIWEVASGQVVQVLQGHSATVEQAQFSPNGEWVATASADKTVRLWQTSSGKLLQTLVHAEAVRTVHFSPDGQRLVTTSEDDMVRVFDRSGQLVWMQYLQQVSDTAMSPNGDLLVTADRLGKAYLWDAHTGKLQAALNPDSPDSTPIVRVFFSPDGQFVATQTQDGKLALWAATREMLLKLARQRSPRQLTPEECTRYLNLSVEACPVLDLGN